MSKQEDANLILRLYEIRREPVMREARNWFFGFNPTTSADYMEAMMGPQSGYLRMFNDANGEHLFVFAKIEPVLEELRQQWNQPDMLKHFETLVRRVPENKEKLAAIRERIKMIQAMMAERNQAQAATA